MTPYRVMLLAVAALFLTACSSPVLSDSSVETTERAVVSTTKAAGVSVTYEVSADWGNGYNVTMTIKNTASTTLNGWTLDWSTSPKQTITNSWSSTLTTTATGQRATPVSYNASIAPQASVSFGYTVSGSSASTSLSTLAFNGVSLLASSSTTPAPPTVLPKPVDRYGQLKVVGNRIVDKNGAAVQLRGVSSHGLQWFPFVAHQTVKNLVSLLNPSVIRAAMYVKEWDAANNYYAGYLGVHPQVKQTLIATVEDAIDEGMYVIVDWHIHWNPPTAANTHWTGSPFTTDAVAFFKELGQRVYNGKALKDYPNVIWEVVNEPGSDISWDQVKTHANSVIQQVRVGNNDPDNLILVPANNWAQNLDTVAWDGSSNRPDRVTSNVAYTLHFYAASHGADVRSKAQTALNAGLAVFADEWGVGSYTGAGTPDYNSSQTWVNWMADNSVSWTTWNVSDKAETSALLVPGAGMSGPWTTSQLSTSGSWVKNWIANGR